MEHSHKTKDEVIDCAVWFGKCWHQASQNFSGSNQPHGTKANDE